MVKPAIPLQRAARKSMRQVHHRLAGKPDSEMEEQHPDDDIDATGIGDNSDEMLKKHVSNVAKLEMEKDEIGGRIKDELNAAKKNGFKKMSIRGAVKDLRMSEDQRQSHKEVEVERRRIVDVCWDLPLFRAAEKSH